MPMVQPAAARANVLTGPRPPRLHWALVLLFTVITFGLFFIVWMFIQSIWVRRIDPKSKATGVLAIYVGLVLVGQVLAESSGVGSEGAVMGLLLVLAGSVVSIFGFFSMRRSMLNYCNQNQPGSLKLSAALTLFLNVFYFQYHMTRIAERDPGVGTPGR